MKFPRFLLVCLALLPALWLGSAQAEPSIKDVQAATQRGDYAAAEKMTREVIAARPDSAKAHYVLAEILAHERKFSEAATHVQRARGIDPAIKFADPARFSAFEQLLQREQAAEARPAGVPAAITPAAVPARAAPEERGSGGGVPVWVLIVGAGLFIWLAASWMRRRSEAQAVSPPAMAGGYGGGYPGGYAPQPGYGAGLPAAPGGSGLMGVGLAAAGGVAAGMLAEKLLHEGRDDRSLPRSPDAGVGGGLLPGSFDSGGNAAADELARRDIDFGSGDGWGGADVGTDVGTGGSDDW